MRSYHPRKKSKRPCVVGTTVARVAAGELEQTITDGDDREAREKSRKEAQEEYFCIILQEIKDATLYSTLMSQYENMGYKALEYIGLKWQAGSDPERQRQLHNQYRAIVGQTLPTTTSGDEFRVIADRANRLAKDLKGLSRTRAVRRLRQERDRRDH